MCHLSVHLSVLWSVCPYAPSICWHSWLDERLLVPGALVMFLNDNVALIFISKSVEFVGVHILWQHIVPSNRMLPWELPWFGLWKSAKNKTHFCTILQFRNIFLDYQALNRIIVNTNFASDWRKEPADHPVGRDGGEVALSGPRPQQEHPSRWSSFEQIFEMKGGNL